LLHGPSTAVGLTESDWETWGEMEDACRAGKVKHLGISNVNHEQLVELHEKSQVKPKFVQNRCFAEKRWDKEIREICTHNGIFYQGFSLLTANWKFLGGEVERPAGRNIPHFQFSEGGSIDVHKELQSILQQTEKTIQQIVFRFAKQIGMIPIIGTRSASHMKLDLEIQDFTLTEAQIEVLENLAFLV
jgi:diketogulonate reductase-like aldo/keto reductase